jgi:hypothetical protein
VRMRILWDERQNYIDTTTLMDDTLMQRGDGWQRQGRVGCAAICRENMRGSHYYTVICYAVLDPGRITRKRHTLLYPNDASDSIGVCCQNALNLYWKFVLLGAEGFETNRD